MNIKPDHDRLYEIAESQAGYFTAAQAGTVGFSWDRLSKSVKSGKFLRVAQGIYRLTHFPASPFEDFFVAWLVTGPHSVISHESALLVYNLSDVLPAEVHVIVPRTASRRRAHIRMHTSQIHPSEITTREGLPVTTVVRTIADVTRGNLPEEQVRQAIGEALKRGLTTSEELRTQAARYKGRAKKIIDSALDKVEDL